MLLSIIIPVYNVEKYIEKCIRSCVAQDISKEDYEIVVVNDGSPDNSLNIVQQIAGNYSNIKVISQPNMGLSAARNTGMRNASGEYYMFVDSDDWIAENCLGRIFCKLKTDRPDALAICAANVKGDILERRQTYSNEKTMPGWQLLKNGVSPCAPFAIWSASFLKKFGLTFYVGIFHEDSEFTPRAYYLAEKIAFLNEIVYYVYQNPNSITRSTNPKRSFDLVNVVCPRLSNFCENTVQADHKVIFYKLISMYLNNALAYICTSEKEQQRLLNNAIFANRYLFEYMKNSVLKYRLEALLFQMLPNHYVEVYKTIKMKIF